LHSLFQFGERGDGFLLPYAARVIDLDPGGGEGVIRPTELHIGRSRAEGLGALS
jgi:hypothetical protein